MLVAFICVGWGWGVEQSTKNDSFSEIERKASTWWGTAYPGPNGRSEEYMYHMIKNIEKRVKILEEEK